MRNEVMIAAVLTIPITQAERVQPVDDLSPGDEALFAESVHRALPRTSL